MQRERHWIPDLVGDDRKGKAGACGGSAPRAEVLLFRQKDPKPGAPGRGPLGAFAPVPKVRAAELALLRQSCPHIGFGTGAQLRLEAP